MNLKTCRLCGRLVDFDEPWCDHETMEESAWLDIEARLAEVRLNKQDEEILNKFT